MVTLFRKTSFTISYFLAHSQFLSRMALEYWREETSKSGDVMLSGNSCPGMRSRVRLAAASLLEPVGDE